MSDSTEQPKSAAAEAEVPAPSPAAEQAEQSAAVEKNEPAGDELQYDGVLPEFSDDEDATSGSAKRTGLPKGAVRVGGPGKKRLPLPALNKLKKASAASASKGNGQSAAAAASSNKASAAAAAAAPVNAENQLQQLMAQLAMNNATANEDGLKSEDLQKLMQSIGLNKDYLQGKRGLMGRGTKDMASHKFWATQPVPKLDTAPEEVKEGSIEGTKPAESISKEPVPLHKDFKWVTIDVTNDAERKEVQDLLTSHYVEDEDSSFRLDYSSDFLEWALKPPGFDSDWHIGIRVTETGKLVGFIAGVPIDLRVRTLTKRFIEINFLCVHKKLRSKRLAPILIKEVTRRCQLKGMFYAIYTAGVFLPTPISRCQYYHRSLNPRKLVETGFSALPKNQTLFRMQNHYRVPEETTIPGLREMEKRDLKQVARLIRAYLARWDVAPTFSNKEIEHHLLTGRGKDVDGKRVGQVVWSYVVEDPETKQITDTFSFYSLPSTAVKSKPFQHINAAYMFYYATTACSSCADLGDGSQATHVTNWQEESAEDRQKLKERLNVLVSNALTLAHKLGFDVFNALTLQDNALFLEQQKFGRGDGFLHYYLYNYMTKPVAGGIDAAEGGSGIGVVML